MPRYLTLALLLALPLPAAAYSSGINGYSASGCGPCHGSSASADTAVTFSAAGSVEPGETIAVQVTVANAVQPKAGLDVSASGGSLAAGGNTQLKGSDVTHSGAASLSGGVAVFEFYWTAPSAEGSYTLSAAGNAVNSNSAASGDAWNKGSVTIAVDDPCDDADADGVTTCDDDCDDADAGVYPGADEVCDGLDNDCDGGADEDALDATAWYLDEDGDGYGSAATIAACERPDGYAGKDEDCDDADPAFYPGAAESCAAAIDYNCDGSTAYEDTDGDGAAACEDCDDADAGAFPGGAEVCDGADVDEDCDGLADDADPSAIGGAPWYLDADGDGYGAGEALIACEQPEGHAAASGDCDDENGAYNPEADESCDGADDDCDGVADEPEAVDALTWYPDADADGFGDSAAGVAACDQPEGHVGDATDCDDDDSAAYPGAAEVWYDGIDQDCAGGSDYDADGDGVEGDADCDDADAAVAECGEEQPDEDAEEDDQDGGGSSEKGCSTLGAGAAGWLWLGALGLLARRRR